MDDYKFFNYEDDIDQAYKASIYTISDTSNSEFFQQKDELKIRINLMDSIRAAQEHYNAKNADMLNEALSNIRLLLPCIFNGVNQIIKDLKLIEFLINLANEEVQECFYHVISCLSNVYACKFDKDMELHLDELFPIIFKHIESEDIPLRFQIFACLSNVIQYSEVYIDQILELLPLDMMIENSLNYGVPFIQVTLLIITQVMNYFKICPQEDVLIEFFMHVITSGAGKQLFDNLGIALIATLKVSKEILQQYFQSGLFVKLSELIRTILPDSTSILFQFLSIAFDRIPSDAECDGQLVRSIILQSYPISDLFLLYQKTSLYELRDILLKLSKYSLVYNLDNVNGSDTLKFVMELLEQFNDMQFSTKSAALGFIMAFALLTDESTLDLMLKNDLAETILSGLEWGSESLKGKIINNVWEMIQKTQGSIIHDELINQLRDAELMERINDVLDCDDLEDERNAENILDYISKPEDETN
ncbi:hypothetical protein TVAG_118940 [Trichomonas vaginalis G3]|uniref:Uncharacterized protein n=1 Tax=Trichomonas vaginalis (strain ATCC PRA-98 / G3) TaxID=412133 RepID=A2D742_TRIV3|nr:armadillo (ARM) repeat-containing protein family [Trichomonas vaginalis G3]EAY23559.1 hypothetical protein TVAG_118940 [Trichomonas vaginalis G3]KAI5490057.1 armadillo (ARM) repeat-containing protein family [Trichomonas vaginalis G3]|eukprot:XP_001276807.1 hypothetical protein [Trichomonas vaginalis G3]